MASKDIQIPFGPDKTNGVGFQPIESDASEGDNAVVDPFAEPAVAPQEIQDQQPLNEGAPIETQGAQPANADAVADSPHLAALGLSANKQEPADQDEADTSYEAKFDDAAIEQGMDDMQMSILALKDSIGQGRELKAREKEREELADALQADHEELADREYILANYHTIVAEQDSIIAQATQQREARKDELARVTMQMDQTQQQLNQLREQHAQNMQPIEGDLGRAQASADQAKNDERSRKSELSAAESELRRASDGESNAMAIARHEQAQAAYDEAHRRSTNAKERLAQIQHAYDDAKNQAEQALAPLEHNLKDYEKQAEELKESIARLADQISTATNRRQYCDTVYQYPDETAKIRSEVENAEEVARRMDAANDELRQKLQQSKQRAKKAKFAIGILIAVIVVFIITFIVVSSR